MTGKEEKVQLTLMERQPGKKHSKALRRQGHIPVVVYGNNKDNIYAYAEDMNFRKTVFPNSYALFNLKTQRGDVLALAKNIDYETLTNTVIHADFYAVDANKEVTVNVSIHFEGEPVGLKNNGEVNKILEEIEVECLASDIPDTITVDISHLDIDDKILVSDLSLPEKVKLLTDPEETLVVINEHVEVSDEDLIPDAVAEAASTDEAKPEGEAAAEGEKKEEGGEKPAEEKAKDSE